MWRKGIPPIRKPGSSRKATIMTEKNVNSLQKMINGRRGISIRELANKYHDKLIPFINEYHADDNYIFWTDLATYHKAKGNRSVS